MRNACRVRKGVAEGLPDEKEFEKALRELQIDSPESTVWRGETWGMLLAEYPEFRDRCDFSKFDGLDWVDYLSFLPDDFHLCAKEKLGEREWMMLLMDDPARVRYCDADTARKLGLPDAANISDDDLRSLSGPELLYVLFARPELVDKVDVGQMNDFTVLLLDAHPEWVNRFDLGKLELDEVATLLKKHPEWAQRCDLKRFDRWDIAQLALIDKFDSRVLADDVRRELVLQYPELSTRRDLSDEVNFFELENRELAHFLGEHPDLAGRCDLNKLGKAGELYLARDYPEVANELLHGQTRVKA